MWEELEMGLQRKTGWDLNLGAAAIEGEDHVVLEERKEDHVVLGCSFLPHGFEYLFATHLRKPESKM